jgi:uracil-DNA glycosylase
MDVIKHHLKYAVFPVAVAPTIDNKLYIIIGAKAAKIFFPDEDYNDLIFKNNILFNKPAIVLPHPSPLNIKWFKDNPDFMKKRIIEIRKIINDTLNKN